MDKEELDMPQHGDSPLNCINQGNGQGQGKSYKPFFKWRFSSTGRTRHFKGVSQIGFARTLSDREFAFLQLLNTKTPNFANNTRRSRGEEGPMTRQSKSRIPRMPSKQVPMARRSDHDKELPRDLALKVLNQPLVSKSRGINSRNTAYGQVPTRWFLDVIARWNSGRTIAIWDVCTSKLLSATEVRNASELGWLLDHVARSHGFPDRIEFDKGELCTSVIQDWAIDRGIRVSIAQAMRPEMKGLIERFRRDRELCSMEKSGR